MSKTLNMRIDECRSCPFVFYDTDQNCCKVIAKCGNPDTPTRSFEHKGNREITWKWEGMDEAPLLSKGFIAPFCPLPDTPTAQEASDD